MTFYRNRSSLDGVVYAVSDPKATAKWYNEKLGMVIQHSDDNEWMGSYTNGSCRLTFIDAKHDDRYENNENDVYCQISLYVADVEMARELLMKKGVEVAPGKQFGEIGYLTDFTDNNGFRIQLVQETFESNYVAPKPDEHYALGQKAVIGLITLRCSDIEDSLNFYQKTLGMDLMAVMPFDKCTLYYLSFTDDTPPDVENLNSVGNREWLWQRKYTTLELKHVPGSKLSPLKDVGVGIRSLDMTLSAKSFARAADMFGSDDHNVHILGATDPDGVLIHLNLSR